MNIIRKSIIFAIALILILIALSPYINYTGVTTHLWGAEGTDYITDVDVDSRGNVIAVGITSYANASYGGLFIVKFSKDGELIWNRYFDPADIGVELAWSLPKLAVDSHNDIYVVITLTDGVETAPVILKLQSDGSLEWVKVFTYEGLNTYVSDIEISANNVVLCGWMSWETAREGLAGDGYVLMLNSNGEAIYSTVFDIDDLDTCCALALSGGYIYVVGVAAPHVVFTPPPPITTPPFPTYPPIPTISPIPTIQPGIGSNLNALSPSPERKLFVLKFKNEDLVAAKAIAFEDWIMPVDITLWRGKVYVSAYASEGEVLLVMRMKAKTSLMTTIQSDDEEYTITPFEITRGSRRIYIIGTAFKEEQSYIYINVFGRRGGLIKTLKIYKDYMEGGLTIKYIGADKLLIGGFTNSSALSIHRGKFKYHRHRLPLFTIRPSVEATYPDIYDASEVVGLTDFEAIVLDNCSAFWIIIKERPRT